MNNETSESRTGMSSPGVSTSPLGATSSMGSAGTMGSTGMDSMATPGTVHRVAQKAHETVDRLEQTLGSSSERMMSWQQEYGEMAREQVRANPLMVVAGAFAIGFLFAKLTR